MVVRLLRQYLKKLPTHSLRIDSADDLSNSLYWADAIIEQRLLVPTELVVMQGAFAYAQGWHPFVQTLQVGRTELNWYYECHQPKSLAEMYFLNGQHQAGENLPPWELPWYYRLKRDPPCGEKGLSSEQGLSLYGPATPAKIDLEYKRLSQLKHAIDKTGYQPDQYGDITGYFLRTGNQYRFFVRGGKHRAAVLAALGNTHIPVSFKRNWPRSIDLPDVANWPLVRDKTLSTDFAAAIFDRYFSFNGSQQQAVLVRSSAA